MIESADNQALRGEIIRVCRRLYERGLIAGGEGNVSARMNDGRVLITPAGASKVEGCICAFTSFGRTPELSFMHIHRSRRPSPLRARI